MPVTNDLDSADAGDIAPGIANPVEESQGYLGSLDIFMDVVNTIGL
jgi:hypothetical protein